MDARQLRYFLAVVENGGVTRASEALYVSQPSLSQTIKTLEKDLGARLFEKHGRGLRLTDAGRALLGPARGVRAALLDATEAIQRVEQLQTGSVEIAVTEDVMFDPLVSILVRFRAQHPDVLVNLLAARDAEDAAGLVRNADCELALCTLPESVSGLQAVPFERRTLSLVLPPDYPGPPAADPVPIERLGEFPLVAAPVGEVVRDLVEQAAQAAGANLWCAVECGSADAVPHLVLNRAGAAFLPKVVAGELARSGATVHATRPTITQQIGFLTRKDSLSAASRALLLMAQRVVVQRIPDKDVSPAEGSLTGADPRSS